MPNQAMELTASRRTTQLQMSSTRQSAIQCLCCSLAELPVKETQAHERKPKKRTGRSRVGGSGGVPIVIEGHVKGGAIADLSPGTDIGRAIRLGSRHQEVTDDIKPPPA